MVCFKESYFILFIFIAFNYDLMIFLKKTRKPICVFLLKEGIIKYSTPDLDQAKLTNSKKMIHLIPVYP